MNAISPGQVPAATPAALVLAAAWVACVDELHLGDVPRFSIDGGEIIDLSSAAELLSERAKPVWLTPTSTSNFVAIDTRPQTPRDSKREAQFVDVALTEGPREERRILVLAGRARYRASPADLDAVSGQFRLIAPCAAAGDYANSGFVSGLGLHPSELQTVAEVLVFGRATEQGWSLPVVPSLLGDK